jgi:hypothetical protein
MQKVYNRITDHRAKAKAGANSNFYKHMRKVGIHKWTIKTLKVKEADDRKQLEKLEFKWMAKYPTELLLNMDIEFGKKSAIGQRGEKTARFKRGSIMRCKDTRFRCVYEYIKFTWFIWTGDKRTRKEKAFSILKYGEKEARKLAEEYQNKIYPQ